ICRPGPGVPVHSPHRRFVFECGWASGCGRFGPPARGYNGEVLMTHRNIKIAATAVVLASAFVFMMWTTLRDGAEYFKHVDEVVAQRPTLEGKQLQMHGYVIPGS